MCAKKLCGYGLKNFSRTINEFDILITFVHIKTIPLKLSFTEHTLNFKRPFKIAHGTRSSTPVVIVAITHDGLTGYGEASMPPYLGESHETVIAFLQKAEPLLKSFRDPSEIGVILKEID
ncbi:MAG: hypothetical protein H0X46_10480, partial [Bacteroidetes bacterium]|nr:hypothetical protein [Bacteroidota bacterium]